MLKGFLDADQAGDIDERKSTTGHAFALGSGVISWETKKQPLVALSTIKVEYKTIVGATCEVVWLRRVLYDLKLSQMQPTTLQCDNQSAIKMM